MAEVTTLPVEQFKAWKSRSMTEEMISRELQEKGYDSLQITELIQHYKKKCCEDRQSTGFIVTGIGAFLGFISCVMTMLDLIPEFRGFMLYGLTGIGVTIAFIGLYLIFEE
jgi:hypothetical protein